jgi:hypothetical protein
MEKTIQDLLHLSPFALALTAMMAATNFAISISIAPTLTLLIPHAFVGAFLMVPLDLFLAYIVWALTRKPVFTLYFLVYGLLTMPTTIWGSTPGLFKPFLGILIGLSLDLLTLKLKPQGRFAQGMLAIVFPVIFWCWTALVWQVAGLPIVQIFQTMIKTAPVLSSIVPSGFIATFVTLALLTMPSSFVAVSIAVSLTKRVEKIVPASAKETSQLPNSDAI